MFYVSGRPVFNGDGSEIEGRDADEVANDCDVIQGEVNPGDRYFKKIIHSNPWAP